MSEFGNSINEKKRFILRNPDGTFMHCIKAGEKDSAMENKENLPNTKPARKQYSAIAKRTTCSCCFVLFLHWVFPYLGFA